jgi:pre-mRNA-processing factor 6
VAALFSDERKHAKARKWFDRAVKIDDTIGDVWAHYYAFELKHGAEDTQRDVLQR